VLVIVDLRDQPERWTDVCAEAGLNPMTVATGLATCNRTGWCLT
jgi:hypothetical protein